MDNGDIRTTVDINVRGLKLIEDFAERKNMTISDVMNIMLIKHMEKLANNPVRNNHAMKYRKRGTQYTSRHIRLSPITYSRLRDIMILFRYTLSYLLSLAMEFFDDYLGEQAVEPDCYPPAVHCVIVTMVDNFKLFANYWGIPPAEHEIVAYTDG